MTKACAATGDAFSTIRGLLAHPAPAGSQHRARGSMAFNSLRRRFPDESCFGSGFTRDDAERVGGGRMLDSTGGA